MSPQSAPVVPPTIVSRTPARDTTALIPRQQLVAPVVVDEVVAVPARRAPLAATALTLLGALLLGFALHVGVLSHVLAAREQSLAYADLRLALAEGVAPVGQTVDGVPVPLGTPIALLTLPGDEVPLVVLEGTTARVLDGGPGHRRDSALPGQAGTAVLFGRRAAYGGAFHDIASIPVGRVLKVTTGQGSADYRVTGVRRAGDPAPAPLAAGTGRLTLVTATGPSYLPSGTVRLDAELVSAVQPSPPRPITAGALLAEEAPLASDRGVAVSLLLWSQLLLLAACGFVWARTRWGLRQAWVVGVPVLSVVGVAVAHSAAGLLPNLL